MENTQTGWMCIQMPAAINKKSKPWFKYDTFSGYRKESIKLLLGNMSWKEAKSYGWVCMKVTQTTTVDNTPIKH